VTIRRTSVLRPHWVKSSYSGGNDNCVEIADMDARVAVRDSKNLGLRPTLVSRPAWEDFLTALTEGNLR
jgi:hypothetical protein